MGTKTTKTEGKKGNERFRISGKAFWAHVTEVNKLSQKFQMDLSIDEETAKALEAKGVEIKTNDRDDEGKPENHRGKYVTLKSEYPPKLFDAKKNEITKKTLVGNGSVINVATHVYDWKFGRDTGTSLGLDAIQLVELVEYKDSMGDLFDETDGYEESEASSEEDVCDDASESRTPPVSKDNPF